jgi:beta-lactamase class A
VIAWYARNLTSGRVSASREHLVMPSFSTIKVLLAAAFWRAVAAGELRGERPFAFQPWQAVGGAGVLRGFRHAAQMALADYLHLALAVSDNDATNIVLAFVGFDRVAALAAELGLAGTALRRQMMDWEAAAAGRDNVTCARDLAALLEMLVR